MISLAHHSYQSMVEDSDEVEDSSKFALWWSQFLGKSLSSIYLIERSFRKGRAGEDSRREGGDVRLPADGVGETLPVGPVQEEDH